MTVRPPSRSSVGLWMGLLAPVAVALVPLGCKGGSDAATCVPPPANLVCADGGGPSYADVYANVFNPSCVTGCHSPTGVEPGTSFTSYTEIYGPGGQEAREIFNQVFDSCLMPPGDAPPLSAAQRQTLLDWYACGATDSPSSSPADAGGQ